MDLKTNFLNGIIEEEVYIEKLQGFDVNGHECHVCRVKKYCMVLIRHHSHDDLDLWISIESGLHEK